MLDKEKELGSNTLDNSVTKDDVTRAQIVYSFCRIKKQASSRCFEELSKCFPIMFVDSEMAKKFRMCKDKLGYVITYGLGPFCQNKVISAVKDADFFSISFDESLNKVARRQQID